MSRNEDKKENSGKKKESHADFLKNKILLWNLAIERNRDACISGAESGLFTEEILLSEHLDAKTNGMDGTNLLWHITDSINFFKPQEVEKFNKLVAILNRQNLITSQMLAAAPADSMGCWYGVNMPFLWLLRGGEGADAGKIIISWIEKGLITREILKSSFKNKDDPLYGLNLFTLMIIRYSHLPFLPKMKDHIFKIIDRDILLASPKSPNPLLSPGVNVVGLLAYLKMWDWIDGFIKHNLFSSEMLLSEWVNNNDDKDSYRKGSVIHLVFLDKRWDIFRNLLESDLITSEMLTPYPGIFGVLAAENQWKIIETLRSKKLVDPLTHPFSFPEDHVSSGSSSSVDSSSSSTMVTVPLAGSRDVRMVGGTTSSSLRPRPALKDDEKTSEALKSTY